MFDDELDDEKGQESQQKAMLAAMVAQQAKLETEHEVPNWNRGAAFEQFSSQETERSFEKPWWQKLGFEPGLGLAGAALACSVSIIALVTVYVNSNAVLDQQAIAALIKTQVAEQLDVEVNGKLRDFASEQQVILANYKAELSARQESSNLQLAGYVISSARSERKEDFTDFVKFINAQRKDEQLAQKIKFQQLEQAIGYRKANFNPSAQNP